MLVHEGDERSSDVDLKLATLLAGVAGALNGAGFLAADLFSANMTGNVSSLSDFLASGQIGIAAPFALMLVVFILGAGFSGFLIELGRQKGVRAIYAYSIVFEAYVLILLCAFGQAFPGFRLGVVVCLSFLMGLQNAATTRISDARVRTTHVSGMATDIGLGLAALAHGEVAPRFVLAVFTFIAFFAGGMVGALAYMTIGDWLFLAAGLVLLAIALPEAHRAKGA